MATQIQLRRDTAANWDTTNPVLAQGEAGYALDTGELKLGDGTTPWNALKNVSGGATGGGTDDVFYENSQTVTTNYTITTDKNAMSAGPITIASGITVTIPSGVAWVVV